MNAEGKVPPEDRAALQQARETLAAQQEVESLLAEILDDKPPANWGDLVKGALTQDV